MIRHAVGTVLSAFYRPMRPALVAALTVTGGLLSGASVDAAMAQSTGVCPMVVMDSPIDIEGTDPVRTHALEPHYSLTPVVITRGAQGLEFPYGEGSELLVGNKRFTLREIRIKTPSEHTVLGQRFDAEIQLVHSDEAGRPAVVAALVSEGAAHPAAEELWPHLPLEDGQTNRSDLVRYNARDLLPHSLAYYRYQGSLTHGDCTAGVSWYVLKTPVQMSLSQLGALSSLQGQNAAPLRPRDYRIILDTAQ